MSEQWFSAGNLVLDENRLTVARCTSHEDATRIAGECNAHAELVRALDTLRENARATGCRNTFSADVFLIADTAIKLAKERA